MKTAAHTARPVIWSVAGTDSGGGAGLAADQRAAEALGVHLCPVAAAVTAQNTVAVTHIQPLPANVLQAQLDALSADLPPAVIKVGMLGSADNARVLARHVDRLRRKHRVDLVVDPVLRASTGALFADATVCTAYRDELLPRATVITPNRAEALHLLGLDDDWNDAEALPAIAARLHRLGPHTVCITGGDTTGTLASDWLSSPHAQGWLSLPRVSNPHHHGTGCTFATAVAATLAIGFVSADACILAKMLTTHGLVRARPLGHGCGAVLADPAFACDPARLPILSTDASPPLAWPAEDDSSLARPSPGIYPIVSTAASAIACMRAGVTTLQLRIKRPETISPQDTQWLRWLELELQTALTAARAAGVRLYINDHWQLARTLGAEAVHLGQEDLLGLTADEREQLRSAVQQSLALGLSTHSVWELCRANGWRPAYVACGPVWPTTTKNMPWKPQGLDNLSWWVRMSPVPVVAIGGILALEQLTQVAATGASGACLLRALHTSPSCALPDWIRHWNETLALPRSRPAWLPHPSLNGEAQ